MAFNQILKKQNELVKYFIKYFFLKLSNIYYVFKETKILQSKKDFLCS